MGKVLMGVVYLVMAFTIVSGIVLFIMYVVSV